MKNKMGKNIVVYLFAFAVAAGVSLNASAALFETYDFESGAEGWTEVGPATFDSADGDLTITFAEQTGEPVPQTSTFVSPEINLADSYTITQFAFDFAWSAVAPSALFITFGNDNYSVYQALTPANGLITVSLTSSTGWLGSTAEFASLVSDFNFVELSVSRSGTAAQSFSLDDFQITYENSIIPPENISAVPEPTTISLLLFVLMLGIVARRYRQLEPAAA